VLSSSSVTKQKSNCHGCLNEKADLFFQNNTIYIFAVDIPYSAFSFHFISFISTKNNILHLKPKINIIKTLKRCIRRKTEKKVKNKD
jgi:hypothetical protein